MDGLTVGLVAREALELAGRRRVVAVVEFGVDSAADIEDAVDTLDEPGVGRGDHRFVGVDAALQAVVADQHEFVLGAQVAVEFGDELRQFGVGAVLHPGGLVGDVAHEVQPARVAENEFVLPGAQCPARPGDPDHRHLQALLVERLGVGRAVPARRVGVALEEFAHVLAQRVLAVLGVRVDDVVGDPDRFRVAAVEDRLDPVLGVVTRGRPKGVGRRVCQQPRADRRLEGIREDEIGDATPGREHGVTPGDAVVFEGEAVVLGRQSGDDRRPEFVRAGFARDALDGLDAVVGVKREMRVGVLVDEFGVEGVDTQHDERHSPPDTRPSGITLA